VGAGCGRAASAAVRSPCGWQPLIADRRTRCAAWREWVSTVCAHEFEWIRFIRQGEVLESTVSQEFRNEVEQAARSGDRFLRRLQRSTALLRSMWSGAGALQSPTRRVSPPQHWRGTHGVRLQLEELWKQYTRWRGPVYRRRVYAEGQAVRAFRSSPEYAEWEGQLRASSDDPSSYPCVFEVVYPGPTLDCVGPCLLMGSEGWTEGPPDVLRSLTDALRETRGMQS
jgi:hypothetical protein